MRLILRTFWTPGSPTRCDISPVEGDIVAQIAQKPDQAYPAEYEAPPYGPDEAVLFPGGDNDVYNRPCDGD